MGWVGPSRWDALSPDQDLYGTLGSLWALASISSFGSSLEPSTPHSPHVGLTRCPEEPGGLHASGVF